MRQPKDNAILHATEENSTVYYANGCQYSLFTEIAQATTNKGIETDIENIKTTLLNVHNNIGHVVFKCGRGANHIWVSDARTNERLIFIEYYR
jgi:hypothetical protein